MSRYPNNTECFKSNFTAIFKFQIRLFADEATEMAKMLSTLSTHKILLTLMDQQRSNRVRAAHEHVQSIG